MVVRFKDLKSLCDDLTVQEKAEPIVIKKEYGDISIRQYIPIEHIKRIIEDIVDTSFLTGTFSPLLYEVSMQINIVTLYTDIVFTAKEKQKIYEVFDVIERLNIYQEVINVIPKDQYKTFISLLNDTIKYEIEKRNSFMGSLNEFVNQIPIIGEAAVKGLQGFEPEKLESLMSIINTVENSGGKEINGNNVEN